MYVRLHTQTHTNIVLERKINKKENTLTSSSFGAMFLNELQMINDAYHAANYLYEEQKLCFILSC